MNINDLIGKLDSEVSLLNEVIKEDMHLKDFLLRRPDLNLIQQDAVTSVGRLVIKVKNMDELHEVRRNLIAALPGYTDKRGLTWYSEDMCTEFDSKEYPVTIRLDTSPEDFPEELQSERCKVTRLPDQTFTQKDYAFICEETEGI